MNENHNLNPPSILKRIISVSDKMGFNMASDHLTGSLLHTLAASKPAGMLLELGTGTGISTAWILDGMDKKSTLFTMDNDDKVVSIARQFLGHDPHLKFHLMEGTAFLEQMHQQRFTFDFYVCGYLARKAGPPGRGPDPG